MTMREKQTLQELQRSSENEEEFFMGSVLRTLKLFQTKICHFPVLFSDLVSRISGRFCKIRSRFQRNYAQYNSMESIGCIYFLYQIFIGLLFKMMCQVI